MKISKSERIFNIFNIMIMILLCVIMLYPYLNQIAIALNDGTDTAKGGITIFPRRFTLGNFTSVFNNTKIYMAAVISVARTVLSTVLALTITFAAAYALTRRGLFGRKAITWFLCIPAYIGAGTIPVYMLYRHLGLMNNFLVYVLPAVYSFYNMIIIRSFLQEVPASLEESALIDGANELVIMFKIMIPLSMPVIATVALWIAVGQWNDWTTTLYYVTKPKLYTLQFIMMQIIKESEALQKMSIEMAMSENTYKVTPTPQSVQAAVLIITTLPIMLVYPFLQKYFINGVMLGAVKE